MLCFRAHGSVVTLISQWQFMSFAAVSPHLNVLLNADLYRVTLTLVLLAPSRDVVLGSPLMYGLSMQAKGLANDLPNPADTLRNKRI